MKKISTLTGIIIIIVAAIILFGGVFAYQYYLNQKSNIKTAGLPVQSQQATEGWKTYTNSQYGFEINYPQNWFVQELPNDSILSQPQVVAFSSISFDKIDKNDLSGICKTIWIYVDSAKMLGQDQISQKCDQKTIVAGDITGCEGKFSNGGSEQFYYYASFVAPDKKNEIEIETCDSTSFDSLLNQMASTFKFTK